MNHVAHSGVRWFGRRFFDNWKSICIDSYTPQLLTGKVARESGDAVAEILRCDIVYPSGS